MSKEIERKFLVKSETYKDFPFVYYKQGYLSLEAERTIRVRIANGKGYLTVKGKNKGISRLEYEYEIPIEDAEEMLSEFVNGGVIEKRRYKCIFDGKLWEVDEFLGDNTGLVVAEVELKVENEEVNKPEWIGDEVSNDERYYNSNLINNPYKNWENDTSSFTIDSKNGK